MFVELCVRGWPPAGENRSCVTSLPLQHYINIHYNITITPIFSAFTIQIAQTLTGEASGSSVPPSCLGDG